MIFWPQLARHVTCPVKQGIGRAFTFGSTSSIRAIDASTSSAAVTSPALSRATASVAVRAQSPYVTDVICDGFWGLKGSEDKVLLL